MKATSDVNTALLFSTLSRVIVFLTKGINCGKRTVAEIRDGFKGKAADERELRLIKLIKENYWRSSNWAIETNWLGGGGR
jgi:hypothetical protein